MFTLENTQGYTQKQLDEMNARLTKRLSDYDSDDLNYDQNVKVFSEQIQKDFDNELLEVEKITKIEEIVGVKFPTGLIDKSIRGANDFIDVLVEEEDQQISHANYIGNWTGYYLGHNYYGNRVPIKNIVAIHKNGSRYEV